ncbi:MAG: D-alanyl-D-alanine carboxypeptidase [Saprospiraceae bacterium]|nr:D-alanyl-D-alanine carboxypeptidase [Saprospiraceae bacterium]
MHPFFTNSGIIDLLKSKSKNKKMIYGDGHHSLSHFGPGWMWDDYNDYYQAELSTFPLYGNILYIKKDTNGIKICPAEIMVKSDKTNSVNTFKRDHNNNHFLYPERFDTLSIYEQELPYFDAEKSNIDLLQNLVGTPIWRQNLPLPSYTLQKYSTPLDTVLRRMMHLSDNTLAEHLLLSAGMVLTDSLSLSNTIFVANSKLMLDLPQKLIWVDGSGLSRYNRSTPASIVEILKKMYAEIPHDRLYSFFTEGKSLSKIFDTQESCFLFGKSGSMNGVYNLSGYLTTKKGKKWAFSFMNNNFESNVGAARAAVANILMDLRANN